MAEIINPKEQDVIKFTTSEKVQLLIDRDPNMNKSKLSRLLGYSKQNVSTKIKNNALRTSDLDAILDIMGYEITFTKKANL